ncbi:MAG: hypothetical protein E7333_08025 [Clostridiales bacterium]|nr:hypothetical protein [Clostridiales bacterium]
MNGNDSFQQQAPQRSRRSTRYDGATPPAPSAPMPPSGGEGYYQQPMTDRASAYGQGHQAQRNQAAYPAAQSGGYGAWGWQQPVPPSGQQGGYQQSYQPPPMGSTPPASPAKPPRKPGKSLKKILPLLAVLAVAIVAIVVGGNVNDHLQAERETQEIVAFYNDKFVPNVYVDGIHLGGMTWEQGVQAVTEKAQSRNDAWSVRLMYRGQLVREITAGELGMTVNVQEALNQAWGQARQGDAYSRKQAMDALTVTPFEAFSALPAGDTSAIDAILANMQQDVYRAPQDAYVVFDTSKPSNPFTFHDEIPGRMLDVTTLKDQLYRMMAQMESGDLTVEPTEITPTITVAKLKDQVSVRASYYTKISTTSTKERTDNIARALELINGTILHPGEVFSFNGVVGKRSLENGFHYAIEYAYGEERMGIGGGICQASTTLYIAAVQANLEIVKREQHSDKVNYTDYGKDATVNWDGKKIDFTFRNNTDSDIYIMAMLQSDPDNRKRWVAKVVIYGKAMEEGVTYDLVTETVETLPIPEEKVYKKDTNNMYGLTYTTDEKKIAGKEGIVVQSYRVKYVNGVEVERTPMYLDRYEAKPVTIYTGTKKPED